METNWGSVPCFLERGFGSCVLHGHQIVSWSVADCISGDACEIGIHTREDYRCRGLGTLATAAAAGLGLSRYGSVGWHCDEQISPRLGLLRRSDSILRGDTPSTTPASTRPLKEVTNPSHQEPKRRQRVLCSHTLQRPSPTPRLLVPAPKYLIPSLTADG